MPTARAGAHFAAILESITRELSFQGKIRLLPKIAAAAMLLILVMTVTSGIINQRHATRIRHGYYPSVQLSRQLNEGLQRMQRKLQDGVMSKEMTPLEESDAIRDSLLRAIDNARANPVVNSNALHSLRRNIEAYYHLARQTSERMIAGEVGDSIYIALQQMTTQYNTVTGEIDRNITDNRRKIEEAFQAAGRLQVGNTTAIAVVAVLAVIFLWVFSVFTARLLTTSLTDPLSHAVKVADRLAVGDVEIDQVATADGEVGRLLHSMGEMVRYLREMASAAESIAAGDLSVKVYPRSPDDTFGNAFQHMVLYLNEMAQVAKSVSSGNMAHAVVPRSAHDSFGHAFEAMIRTLSQTMQEIREAAEVISAASAQVAGSSATLSQRTAEEASSVAKVNASVARVTGLVARNAESSRAMEEMALRGARDAEDTGAATRATVEAMERIAEQILVVDQLASQTNVLAVNAAIEAARAGDYGKGFNVVAAEVGKLALGSKAAAREITGMVRSSHEIAERSGALLSTLVPSIAQTAALVEQVATASEQQARDLELVGQSMADVEGATQRNASAAQELAATASALAAQAESLQRALNRFQIYFGAQHADERGHHLTEAATVGVG